MNVINIEDKLKFNGVRECCECAKVACRKLKLDNYAHLSFPVYKFFCKDCAPNGAIDLNV